MVNKKSHDWCHHPGGVSVFLPSQPNKREKNKTKLEESVMVFCGQCLGDEVGGATGKTVR